MSKKNQHNAPTPATATLGAPVSDAAIAAIVAEATDNSAAPIMAATTVPQTTEATDSEAADLDALEDTDADQPVINPWPVAVKFALGDGAKFEGKGRSAGTDSIRVGIIHYAISERMVIPFTLYKRVATGQATGGTLSLSLPTGVELVGLNRNDPEVSAWLETETIRWVDWFRSSAQAIPTAARAVGKGFSGVKVDF